MERIIEHSKNVYVDFFRSLLSEGFVTDKFLELQEFREVSPDCESMMVSLFYTTVDRLINNMDASMHNQVVDYNQVANYVSELDCACCALGAKNIRNACVHLRKSSEQRNIEGCLICLQNVRREYCLLKNKLQELFKLGRQIMAVGGVVPTLV